MKLTPLDIRKQEFSRKFRGYDPEEVGAFLQMVATQWEEIRDECQGLDSKLGEMRAKLDHYEKVEEALEEALRITRESSEKTIRNAEEKARALIEKAEFEARQTEEHARQTVNEIRRQASRLNDYRLELMARLRALLTSETELLARYEEHASVVLNKLYAASEGEAKMQSPAGKTAKGKSTARTKKKTTQTTAARTRATSNKASGAQKIEETPEVEEMKEGESGGAKDSSSDIQHIRRILSDLD